MRNQKKCRKSKGKHPQNAGYEIPRLDVKQSLVPKLASELAKFSFLARNTPATFEIAHLVGFEERGRLREMECGELIAAVVSRERCDQVGAARMLGYPRGHI